MRSRLVTAFALLATSIFLAAARPAGPVAGAHGTAEGAAAQEAGPRRADARAHNLVFMIPDGCGHASIALARLVAGHALALDEILTGTCRTRPLGGRVTDSAAGATAYACGQKTLNQRIAMDAAGWPLATILEAARDDGMATGLVVTSRVTHATPACFAAHVMNRNSEAAIAAQEVEEGIDVLLGGGRDFFLPLSAGGTRRDGRDLVALERARGVGVVMSTAELLEPRPAPLLGLFAGGHMRYEVDRDTLAEPSLAAMTRRALDLLSTDPDGFFLMVEGSRVDHAAHANDPGTMVGEILAYDDAVRTVLDFARKDGRTLVVSVADHETGGLSLNAAGRADSIACRPEVLGRTHASAESIATRVKHGDPPAELMRELGGIDSLTDEESARIERARNSRAGPADVIAGIISKRAMISWRTHDHTATDVDLYAFGPAADRFRGALENDEVGRRAAAALGIDLAGETRRLRAGWKRGGTGRAAPATPAVPGAPSKTSSGPD